MNIRKEIKIGLLAIAVFIASFFLINFLRGKDVFNREIELVAYFDDVETLVASAPAYFKGTVAGSVSEINYRPETDDFEVVCSVLKEFRIPEDSKIVIYSTSIMGSKGVKIVQGTSETPAQNGSILGGESEADLVSSLTSMIGPLLSGLDSTVCTLNQVLANVNDVLNEENKKAVQRSLLHLDRTLANAEALAKTLNGKSAAINEIVENLRALSEKFGPVADKLDGTMDNLQSITATLNEADLKGTVEKLGGAAATIDTTVDELSQPLDSVLNNIDELIKKISENPKKYLKISVF